MSSQDSTVNFFNLLRVVLIVHLLSVIAQAAFAGMFLSGSDTAVSLHEITARVLVVICLLQIAITALLKVRGRCPAWVLPYAITILLAEIFETYTGQRRILVLHVPLAILIFGGIMRQLFWAVGTERATQEASL
jgi:hypothetical protein